MLLFGKFGLSNSAPLHGYRQSEMRTAPVTAGVGRSLGAMRFVCYYGIMAVRKLTVSIPAELAEELRRRVPARDRSKYVTRALQESFRRSEDALVRACRLANEDPDARAIEEEFDALKDPIVEP